MNEKLQSSLPVNPVFLLGLPRSGTTLLQAMLCRHPEIYSYSEDWILLPLLVTLRKNLFATFLFGGGAIRTSIEDFLRASNADAELYFEAIRSYASVLYRALLEKHDKNIFLSKSPQYYLFFQLLKEIFPHARFIIMIRNPLSIFLSFARTWSEGNCKIIFQRPPHVNHLLNGPFILSEAIKTKMSNCYLVHYEQLISKPEKVLKEVCDYLGIEYQEYMIEYDSKKLGRLKDPAGIDRYSHPVRLSDKWTDDLLEDLENRILSWAYIEFLGEEVFETMGYSYEETKRKIEAMGRITRLHEMKMKALSMLKMVSRLRYYVAYTIQLEKLNYNLTANPRNGLADYRFPNLAGMKKIRKSALDIFYPGVSIEQIRETLISLNRSKIFQI